MKTSSIILILLLLLGCSKVKKDVIKNNFYKSHPNATIINIIPNEGDADNVYYEIKYTLDNKTLKEVFLYQKINGIWKLSK